MTHLLHEAAARLAASTAQVPGEGGAYVSIEQFGECVAIEVAGQIASQQLELHGIACVSEIKKNDSLRLIASMN